MRRDEFTPVTMVNVEHVIDREYRNSQSFQWARELLQNSLEAGATRVEFDVEWQAVKNRNVYRRMCVDDGHGMTGEELKEFFSKLGTGSKAIGGAHENYGVGAKNNLLPWNKAGLVVISLKAGELSMVKAQFFPAAGQYGLAREPICDDSGNQIDIRADYSPYDDSDGPTGCNWADVLPEWVTDVGHGTAVILLGSDLTQDTILGDPERGHESETRGLYAYFNRRYFSFPAHVKTVRVTHMAVAERTQWSRDGRLGFEHGAQRRAITPARNHLANAQASDVVELVDGTIASVYLLPMGMKADRKTRFDGSIGCLYKGELYDITNHMWRHRQFGIVEREVAVRTWVILEPPLADHKSEGVAPTTGRADLKWIGPRGAVNLPWSDWGAEFATRMPSFLVEALRSINRDDESQLADLRHLAIYGARWKSPIFVPHPRANDTTKVDVGTRLRSNNRRRAEPGSAQSRTPAHDAAELPNAGQTHSGDNHARESVDLSGIPEFQWQVADHFEHPSDMAQWNGPSSAHPRGIVFMNRDHLVLQAQALRWRERYADHLAEEVTRCVENAYMSKAVSMCAHIEQQRGVLGSERVDEMRHPAALTAGLMGLVGEDSIIDKLTQRIGKRIKASGSP